MFCAWRSSFLCCWGTTRGARGGQRADRTPPTVSILSPGSGTTYTSSQLVTITVAASDNVDVSKVEFYDGAALKGVDSSAPCAYTWSITSAVNGTHSWTAKSLRHKQQQHGF